MRRSLTNFVLILTLLLVAVYAYTVVPLGGGASAAYRLGLRAVGAMPFLLVWAIPVLYWGGRRESRTALDHTVQYLGFLSMGWLSFLLVTTIFRDLVSVFARLTENVGLTLALAKDGDAAVLVLTLVAFGISVLQAARGLRVHAVELKIPGLPPGLDGFKIVQISDLHVGPTIKRRYVEKVVALANAQAPDLVALTGDIIDGPLAALLNDAAPLGDLTPKGSVYFITGNHEYYAGPAAWLEHFRGLGFQLLLNSHVVVQHRGTPLMVAGVLDPAAAMTGAGLGPDPQQAAQRRAGERGHEGPASVAPAFRILLAHNPKIAANAAAAGYDLQLSGHTHAGQFFPWTLVARAVHAPHFAGLSREGDMTVYVSAGTGTWGPPLRLGTRPEVTLLTLRSQ